MTELIIIRHGQSKANLSGTFVGHINAPLTDIGKLQAKKTAEYVVANYKVDKIYASDLDRAFCTGKAVADLIGMEEITTDKNLREIYAGAWEGVKFDELAVKFSSSYNVWLTDIGNAKADDGESVASLYKRAADAITKIAEENDKKTVVIATHATVIRVFETFVKGKTLSEMKDIPWVSNASVTTLSYENGKYTLDKIGYDEHLGDIKSSLPKNV